MRALLDTSIIVADSADGLNAGAVSVITIAELDFGVRQARDRVQRQQRLARRNDTTTRFDPIPVDLSIAAAWGDLAALTAERGRQPRRRSMDLLIAATAQVYGLTLLTRDEDLLWLSDVLDVRTA